MAELADLLVEQLAVQQRDDLLYIIVNNVNNNSALLSNTVNENYAQLRNIVICSTRPRDIDSARLHDIVNISARLRGFASVYSVHLCGIVNDYCVRLHNIVNIYSTRLRNINSARLRDIVNIHSALLRNIVSVRSTFLRNIINYDSASSPPPPDGLSVLFPNHYHYSPRVLPYNSDDEGSQNAHPLHYLPNLEFPGLNFPGMKMMAWKVAEPAASIQHEGLVTKEPRDPVEEEFILAKK
ncbi:hypothetical protein NUW58_g79 [Xylaria curta]|uniref:Uncharacterized protein n=1 Tax=Xylaria curta TaxID=42375 RepID=A0ACC1PQP8_9PEZI|nr:hypothetical protein NUW58_g79 [Xylaria curta]